MNNVIIQALAAFLGGALIALFNALALSKAVKSEKPLGAGIILLRQVLNIGYFCVVYLIARKSSEGMLWPLLGAAAGLTIPSIAFALTLSKHSQGDDKNG